MRKIFSSLLILLCTVGGLAAQDEALTKTVEVSRAYEPTVPEAYKINPIPRIDDTASVQASFTYPLRQVKPLTEEYLINPIAPARVQRERYSADGNGSRGYARMGLGVKTSSLVDAYYGSERAQKLVWDVFANHYGSFGKVKNEAKEKVPNLNMRNEVGASGLLNLKSGTLYGRAGFRRHDLRLYGYDTELSTLDDYKALPDDDKRQAYNHTYLTLEHKDFSPIDSTLTYVGKVNFYDYRSRMGQAEDLLAADILVLKQLTATTRLGLTLNANAFWRNGKLSASDSDNGVVSLIPEAVERRDWWQATAKFNLTFDNFSGKLKTYFYPVLNFTALLADNMFCPYVELSGEHRINSYRSITTENPYISPHVAFYQDVTDVYSGLRNTQQAVAFRGGMRGSVGSTFGYEADLSYAFVNDMYFFVNDYGALGNHFALLYDDVKQLTLKGNLHFQPMRALGLKAALRYDSYTMDKLEEPYNRPSFGMKLEAKYTLWSRHKQRNELNLYAGASVMGGYKTLPLVDEYATPLNDGKRKAGVDLSLGADYRLDSRSSVFLQVNNLTNNRYHIYSGYPSYGLSVMAGYTRMF